MLQLRVIREEEGRKVLWLARRTGYSISYASKVEKGILPPSDRFKAKAAEAMQRPVEELFRLATV